MNDEQRKEAQFADAIRRVLNGANPQQVADELVAAEEQRLRDADLCPGCGQIMGHCQGLAACYEAAYGPTGQESDGMAQCYECEAYVPEELLTEVETMVDDGNGETGPRPRMTVIAICVKCARPR